MFSNNRQTPSIKNHSLTKAWGWSNHTLTSLSPPSLPNRVRSRDEGKGEKKVNGSNGNIFLSLKVSAYCTTAWFLGTVCTTLNSISVCRNTITLSPPSSYVQWIGMLCLRVASLLQGVGEPFETFIKTISWGGTSGLNVPGTLSEAM